MNSEKHWASVWGNAVSIAENRPESYSKDITLRYPVYSRFDGDAVRITFDNYCGTRPITINKTTVFIYGKFYKVTFNGQDSVTIPAGENAVSDAVECTVTAQTVFFVSFYLANFTQMRSMVFARGPLSSGSYAMGDQTYTADVDINISRKTHYFYFLSNVSVLTDREKRAIVCYGDSITAQNWPDELALRCFNEGYHSTAIIRRATSGSRILREYHCITYESYGLQGSNRFHHEVPTDGADVVIIQQGINDIIHPVGRKVNVFYSRTFPLPENTSVKYNTSFSSLNTGQAISKFNSTIYTGLVTSESPSKTTSKTITSDTTGNIDDASGAAASTIHVLTGTGTMNSATFVSASAESSDKMFMVECVVYLGGLEILYNKP